MTVSDIAWLAIDRDGVPTPLARTDDLSPTAHGFAAVTADTRALLPRALREHPMRDDTPALTLLVAPGAAPVAACHKEPVVAFIATGDWEGALRPARGAADGDICYRLLSRLLAGPEPAARLRIVDRTTPDRAMTPAPATIDVILPHRGDPAYLDAALDGLARQTLPARTILCFDEAPDPALVERLARRDGLAMYQVRPDPAGPYVPRQHFALTSTADHVAFQDSDDISLPTRFATQAAAAAAGGAALIGSHELRCDEIGRRVAAVRYPLDVNRALDLGDGSVQLLPATLANRATLQRLGGFSTDRTFAADRQLQLRAYGSARIVNVDAFLYVRRRRARSLSTSVETGMQAPERLRLNHDWDAALARVRQGAAVDGEAALAVAPARRAYAIRDLRTGRDVPAVLQPSVPPHGARDAKDQSHSDADDIDDFSGVSDTDAAARAVQYAPGVSIMNDQNARDLASVAEDLTASPVTELSDAEITAVTGGIFFSGPELSN